MESNPQHSFSLSLNASSSPRTWASRRKGTPPPEWAARIRCRIVGRFARPAWGPLRHSPSRMRLEELLDSAVLLELADLGEGAEGGHRQDHVLAALVDLLTKQEAFQDRVLRAVPVFADRRRRLRPFDVVAAQEHDQIDRLAHPVVRGDEDAGRLVLHARHTQGDRQVQGHGRRRVAGGRLVPLVGVVFLVGVGLSVPRCAGGEQKKAGMKTQECTSVSWFVPTSLYYPHCRLSPCALPVPADAEFYTGCEPQRTQK